MREIVEMVLILSLGTNLNPQHFSILFQLNFKRHVKFDCKRSLEQPNFYLEPGEMYERTRYIQNVCSMHVLCACVHKGVAFLTQTRAGKTFAKQ